MKSPFSKFLLASGIAAASQVSGLAVAFGPLTFQGEMETVSVPMPASSGSINFSVSFSATGSFYAQVGTPNNTLESYTVNYGQVTVELTSPTLANDPISITFNNVSTVVNYLTPGSGSGPFGPINYSISAVTQNIWDLYSGAGPTEDFDVSIVFLSPPTVTGGKGTENITSSPLVEGAITAVPEPEEYALLTGVSLLAIAGLRRRKK